MDEIILIKNKKIFKDLRGKFLETYSKNIIKQHGITKDFIVDCYSINNKNVIRGMHYQWNKPLDKFITVINGSILDIVIDIRSMSKSFGKIYSYMLSSSNQYCLWVPAGFAHGFLSLEDNTCVSYKFTEYYNPEGEGIINPFDKELNISWKVNFNDIICSEKDLKAELFFDYKNNPKF